MSAKHNFPTTTGIYWARMSRIEGWYRLIVCVGGEAPFLKVLWALDFITDGPVKVNPYDLYFGPEIHRPDVPKDEVER